MDNNLENQIIDLAEEEEEEDEGQVCHICLDGNNYEDNSIVLCDKCDVPVHQLCYGIGEIPQGSWYCNVCASGGDPKTTKCELCSFTGGAYKPTSIAGAWVHGLCGIWIPEIFPTDNTNRQLNITYLDKKRSKLRCCLCTTKGACIQCSYGRCTTAMHPWCAMFTPAGVTHRVVKTDTSEIAWEVFCKAHASAVTEPYKPKVKAKTPQFMPPMEDMVIDEPKAKPKPKPRIIDDDISVEIETNKPPKPMAKGNNTAMNQKKQSVKSSLDKQYPLFNFSEWPGQAEGEGMDLDHFWNIISMGFPEERQKDWCDYMTSVLKEDSFQMSPELMAVPKLGRLYGYDEIDLRDDKKLFTAADRDRQAVIDLDKRHHLLSSVYHNVYKLSVNRHVCVDSQQHVVYLDDKLAHCSDFDEFLRKSFPAAVSTAGQAIQVNGDSMNVIFDGIDNRVSCKLAIKPSNPSTATAADISSVDIEAARQLIYGAADTTHSVPPTSETVTPPFQLEMVEFNSFPSDRSVPLTSNDILIAKEEDDIICRMIRSDQMAYKMLMESISLRVNQILAHDIPATIGTFLPMSRDFQVKEALYIKQKNWRRVAYGLHNGIKDHATDFNRLKLDDLPASWALSVHGRQDKHGDGGEGEEDDEEEVEDSICMICFHGISNDDNRILYCDGCNASLHQACYGIHEIPEGNFYCDRCKEVQYISHTQGKYFSKHDCANAVMCCLCPNQHGGLKATTDSHWVHLCCAIWTEQSVIKDLNDMGPIDLSQVSLTGYIQRSNPNRRNDGIACSICKLSGGYLTCCCDGDCSIRFHPLCAWFEGYYMSSVITDPTFQGADRNGLFPCGLQFSFYCNSHLPPPAATAAATITAADWIKQREEQKQIRVKYHIKLEDLECIPHQSKKKRTPKATPKKNSRGRRGADRDEEMNEFDDLFDYVKPRSSAQAKEKELIEDVYDNRCCAMCMTAIEMGISHEAFNDSEFPPLPLKPTENKELFQVKSVHTGEGVADNHTSQPTVTTSSTAAAPVVTNKSTNRPFSLDSASEVITCVSCGVSSHKKCLQSISDVSLDSLSMKQYKCPVCIRSLTHKQLQCVFCPRKGGFLLPTTENKWCHYYCAINSTCQAQIISSHSDPSLGSSSSSSDSIVDLRHFTKDTKKFKCHLCHRKLGQCERCEYSSLGCQQSAHILCAAITGNGYFHNRSKIRQYYCGNHIPEGMQYNPPLLCKASSKGIATMTAEATVNIGTWIDWNEVARVRYVLDRTRLLFDSLNRREKLKKLVNKAESEVFNHQYQSLLDICHGREVGDMTVLEDEPEEVIEPVEIIDTLVEQEGGRGRNRRHSSVASQGLNNDSKLNKRRARQSNIHTKVDIPLAVVDEGEWVSGLSDVPIGATGGVQELIDMTTDSGEVYPISAALIQKNNVTQENEVHIPSRIFINVAGFEFDSEEILSPTCEDYNDFQVKMRNRMLHTVEATHAQCGIFTSRQHFMEYGKKTQNMLHRYLQMNDSDFRKEMQKYQLEYNPPVGETGGGEEMDICEESNTSTVAAAAAVHVPKAVVEDSEEEEWIEEEALKISNEQQAKMELEKSQSQSTPAITPAKRGSSRLQLDKTGPTPAVASEKLQQPTYSGRGRKPKALLLQESVTKEVTITEEISQPSAIKKRKLDSEIMEENVTDRRRSDSLPVEEEEEAEEYFQAVPNALTTNYSLSQQASHSAGPYLTSGEVYDILSENDIFQGLVIQSQINKPLMENILLSTGVILPSSSSSDGSSSNGGDIMTVLENDWYVYSHENLPMLERRIQDILNYIENYQVPDEEAAVEESPKKRTKTYYHEHHRRKKHHKSNQQAMRNLAEDYLEIPDESLHDYSSYVRHIITVDNLKQQLHCHAFNSMSSFAKAYYEMINNSRAATAIHSKIWTDSAKMINIFEEAKLESLNPVGTSKSSTALIQFPSEKRPSDPCPQLTCHHCSEKMYVQNWPKNFNESSLDCDEDMSWYCGKCIESINPSDLIGRYAHVWWHEDKVSYGGYLDAIDNVTHKYRIQYDDGEWEYLSLHLEPVLIAQNKLSLDDDVDD